MNTQLKALYELQQIDVQLSAAQRAIAALDDGTKLRQQLALAEKQLTALTEQLKKSQSELQDNELNLKSLETKKSDFEKKLYEGKIVNPKELSSIEKEIEALGKTRAKLDERILELYDIVEKQQTDAAKMEAVATQLKKRLTDHLAQYQAKTKDLQKQIETLTASRQAAIATVTDRQLLSKYETIRARYKDTGLSKVENGKCGVCHVGLTSYTQRLLKENEQYQTCESCGRILFLEE